MTSWGGISKVTVRRSIRCIRSIPGMIKTTPGPRCGSRRPNRKTTPRSYSRKTLMPLKRIITAIATTTITANGMTNLRLIARQREKRPAARVSIPDSAGSQAGGGGVSPARRAQNIGRSRLDCQFQAVNRDDLNLGACGQVTIAERPPELPPKRDPARVTRHDRLADLTHLTDHRLGSGARRATSLAQAPTQQQHDYQEHSRAGGDYPTADQQIAARRIDEKHGAKQKSD